MALYSTIIDIHTDRNPNKRCMKPYRRQRYSAMDWVCLNCFIWWYFVTTKCTNKVFFVKTSSKGIQINKTRVFINSLKFPVLSDNKFHRDILCVMCFQVVRPYYLTLSYFVSYIYLWNHCKYMSIFIISFFKFLCIFFS